MVDRALQDPATSPDGAGPAVASIAPTAPPAARDIRDATLVKEGDLFLLADLEGNVPAGNTNGYGLYHRDTRFLSVFDLEVQGLRPTILLSSERCHFLGSYVLANPNLVTEDGRAIHEQSLQIRRYRIVRANHLSESLIFQNFNSFPLALDIALHVGTDFADIFEVRGFVVAGIGERTIATEIGESSVSFRYEGRDGARRATHLRFEPAPASLVAPSSPLDVAARYRVEIAARGTQRIGVEIDLDVGAPPRPTAAKVEPTGAPVLRTSDARFNAILAQATDDLRSLTSGDDGEPFIAAGIPWYAALFGRDSIITALELLWIDPRLAKNTLVLLAREQGNASDPTRDEEPGKILHELRRGELAKAGLVPFGPYFGSVDSTPLWIMLLGEYHRTTADTALLRELLPNLERALVWIDTYGDRDGDGFIEYGARTESGLVNQGWKDSWDGIVHTDGSFASQPIALVEAQAYVFAAKRHAADLFRELGDLPRARELDAQAERLRERFEDAFWMPDEKFYCLALDGEKRRVSAIASNAGHALACGIASSDRAARVIERLVSEDLYSGWGIRTLSSREVRYNPLGYHVGTIWPHDNALIALGLKRYGAESHLVQIATGLYEAAQYFPALRMPELFCGFARSAFGVPVRYPVACNPQAWAAGSWSMITRALLGISIDAPRRELLIVRPALPPWLEWLSIDRLPVGDGQVDLRYARVGDRTVVDVVAMRGNARVSFVDQWLT